MTKISDLRLSKNMKYTALYIAMRYFEHSPNIFEKIYKNGTHILIDSEKQSVFIDSVLALKLDTHESFVKLECVDRLLTLEYDFDDFDINCSTDDIIFAGFTIRCCVWEDSFDKQPMSNGEALYKSRLVSGVLEYKTKICRDGELYDYGLFEQKKQYMLRKQKNICYDAPDFIIEENRVMRYVGKESYVFVPEGIEEIESSAFWDNQFVKEVVLPESLINMGGDTFYNCKNLQRVNIPPNVVIMGNNPFAGCPLIEIVNCSSNFIYEKGALFTKDKKTMIYCSIKGEDKEFFVPEGVEIIGKHTFFLCDRLEYITLPSTLEKMENNPFSGCSKLELINNSGAYYIQDDVIYNGFRTAVVGVLNKIKTKRLELLEGIKTINRNSFWNCRGIETIVFPKSLVDIGYNPFVGCLNIHFESKTPYYKVVDGVLYNADMTKLVCYPSWKAEGIVNVPDSVKTLERGAFSGCTFMTAINLHNVNIINKSCFTNCSSLQHIYCSDLITYIGEWAFAYCAALENISIRKGTIVDNNALSNCNAEIIEREENTNYLIESDNIYTLQSMQQAYKGRVDSILIDPPYNSHIDYIGYKDGDYEEGYLNFMESRIQLSYSLLSEKGFLVINIDESEVENLKLLCLKIFGKDMVSVHKWKKLHEYFDINRDVRIGKKLVTYEYIIICRKSEKSKLGTLKQPYIENGILKEKITHVPDIFDCFGTTASAKDEIKELFGTRDYFSTPKPVKLMKELIRATTNKKSIILDYFAGSGTVGQACDELNKEDGGKRTYVLVCNNESNICERVTNKRLKKINSKYKYLK